MNSAALRDRRRGRWVTRAERVRDQFGLVLALVLITYVLTSLLAQHGWSSVILCLATSATSIVALTSSHVLRQRVRLALVFAALSILLAVLGAATDSHAWLNLATGIQVLLLTVATLAVLMRVVTTPEVNSRTIFGAISVYTVLGILFTFVYATIDRLQSSPFFEGVAHPESGDFLFFSYTTLTTTGFGNLVPADQPGRMISGLEMMIGQIFLVTLVAGLVALWRPGESLRRRREQRGRGGGAEAGAGAGAE